MLEAVGGLGIFLLGMIIMTDGLRALAGHTLRNILVKFTHTPLSGAITGATTTALLQSSSATTVAAVGFVGAGLMTFPAALGIIFGANIGTTITGWIVALLGLKLKLGTVMLPVILAGTALKLFGKGRISKIGYALAGFGLIFVGITFMQTGMAGLNDYFLPDRLATDSIFGILLLVGIGIISTVITQSSSAGVAATLTAVYTGTIGLEQALALVIGMDVGTTVTAAIATIGGSIESRRTGFSHVIYNVFTAIGALILVAPYIHIWQTFLPEQLSSNPVIAVVAFHSSFNILGVIIVLPFTNKFARFMQHLVPDQEPVYTQNLDHTLLKEPVVALTATQTTINNILVDLLTYINKLIGDNNSSKDISLTMLRKAVDETHAYIDNIHLVDEKAEEHEKFVTLIHALDHMQRLAKRCTETNRTATINQYSELENDRRELISSNAAVIHEVTENNWQQATHYASICAQQIETQVLPIRQTIMESIATDKIDIPQANDYLEAIRWLDRVSDHIERIIFHLAKGQKTISR